MLKICQTSDDIVGNTFFNLQNWFVRVRKLLPTLVLTGVHATYTYTNMRVCVGN